MRTAETSDLWWKTAVFYCLDVEKFFDANGDGVGDFEGLTDRVQYLQELGVTCLWLMPFYPSPGKDDGYDVADFYGVDPRLGDLGDLVEFIRAAKDSGMRVIVDALVNHTSDQHPWFRSALRSKNSPHRDYYVWRAEEPPDTSHKVVFPDEEDSIWTKDEKSGEWYLHNFYRHQPDLNTSNPAVRDEIAKMMGFWLELGIDGFRIDAVPFSLEVNGGYTETPQFFTDPHDFLRNLRGFTSRRRGDSVLLGEVNLPYEDQLGFFGGEDANELTMMFDFVGMQYTYLALARQDAGPLVDKLGKRPVLPSVNQWATFLRNHDELTLDKLSDEERQEVFAAFGPEPEMQIFDRGLKRRLPPMLGGDPRRIRMAYSLMFTMGGSPVLFYGEEIGMGENLDAKGRMAVRTPMQWANSRNGGFSGAPPRKLVQPVVEGGYGPEHVNVVDARRDPDSLFHFFKKLIHLYRRTPEIGWGTLEVLDQSCPSVLAHSMTWTGMDAAEPVEGEASAQVSDTLVPMTTYFVHNLSDEAVTVTLDVTSKWFDAEALAGCELRDLMDSADVPVAEDGTVEVPLSGYGFVWLRLAHDRDQRLA